ncbi:MAG: hypothetical protein APR53_10885 [Methanoculleus sp. SDB]|nr:MAG: hypothetical protein APR53_10885 [Methanoculleus sp. SDB]
MSAVTEIIGEFPELLAAAPADVILVVFGLIALVVLFLIKFMGYFRIIITIAQFTYPNALVTVRGNPLLSEEHIDRIIASRDIAEAVSEAQRAGIDVGTGEAPSAGEIEQALKTLYHTECDTLEAVAPESVKPLFRAYCMTEEVDELKHAIRMKHAGHPPEKTEGTLIPVGSLTPDLVRKMREARSVDDLVALLGATPYGEALSGALQHYHDLQIPLPLELALDRFTFGELQAALLIIDAEHFRPAQEFVGAYVDTTNIRILLRAKRDLLDAETVVQYLLPGGSRLSAPALKTMAESKTLQELLGDLDALQLHSAINEAISSSGRTGSLIPLEAALDLYLLETVLDLSTIYRYGPGPLIRFLVARKIEIRNLGIILRGIEGAAPGGTIRDLTVRERVRG